MKESLRGWRRPIAVVALAAGVAACGGSGGTTSAHRSGSTAAADQTDTDIQVKYYPNGTRELIMDNVPTGDTPTGIYPANVFQFCDGRDLYSESEAYGNGSSSSLAIIPGDEVCVDGPLTPSDFLSTPDETPVHL